VFSDLRQTLKEFSEDSRKTSQNTLGKSSNAFYARKLASHEIFRKSSEVFCPKWYKFWICILLWKTSQKTIGRLSEDFLGSIIMYFMLDDFLRSLREVLQSLLPKVVQRNDVRWSPSLSMWRNYI
ncbi:hypothetical protein IGI04_030139, partial [Brassica rapa subsp. trilocularis]